MEKYTIRVEGMKCGMCEAHVADVIRRAVPTAKKVKASRMKNEASFVSAVAVDGIMLKKAISETGYIAGDVSVEPYKGLFGR